MPYKVADGHDVALESLNDVTPQPRTEGIKASRRSYAADSTIYDEAKYVEFEFGVIPSAAEYRTMLTQFGVEAALTNDVTVYVRDESFEWVRMNGTAIRPQPGVSVRWDWFPSRITLLVRNLETAS